MSAVQFAIAGPTPVTFALDLGPTFEPTMKGLADLLAFVSAKPTFNLQNFIKALMQFASLVPQVIADFVPTFNLTALLTLLPQVIAAVQALIAAITG